MRSVPRSKVPKWKHGEATEVTAQQLKHFDTSTSKLIKNARIVIRLKAPSSQVTTLWTAEKISDLRAKLNFTRHPKREKKTHLKSWTCLGTIHVADVVTCLSSSRAAIKKGVLSRLQTMKPVR